MRRDGLSFICTRCRQLLAVGAVERGDETEIIDGSLVCSSCGCESAVRDGIPRFVPPRNYAASFGFHWNTHARTQLDSYSGQPISRERLFTTTSWPQRLDGERVLEAGSGVGRFTEVLLETGAHGFSFDYSDAVSANARNNGGHANLTLFQGDIFDIPLPNESFDKGIFLGVLQHTPDPERASRSLTNLVRPGGPLVIDIYLAGLVTRMQWKYLLRPVTKRVDQVTLYHFLERVVPPLIGLARALRRLFGRAGAWLSPIVEYSDLNLCEKISRERALLETFDMSAPAHGHPRSVDAIRRWFVEAGFTDVVARRGLNGVIGRGRRPETAGSG
jgi:SAM-dependent methyltransferase